MIEARIFQDQSGEWFIEWPDRHVATLGPWRSAEDALVAYLRDYREQDGQPSRHPLELYVAKAESTDSAKDGDDMTDIKVVRIVLSTEDCGLCKKAMPDYDITTKDASYTICHACVVRLGRPEIRFAVAALVERELEEGAFSE